MSIDIQITKQELLQAAGVELARLAWADSQSNGAAARTTADAEDAPNGKKRRRRVNKKLTPSRSVPAQQILELIRSKGPMRGIEIMEATGLSSGAVRAKVNELKEGKALTEEREGTIIRFAATRGAGAVRKSTRRPNKKTPRAAKKKRAYNKKAAASTVATA